MKKAWAVLSEDEAKEVGDDGALKDDRFVFSLQFQEDRLPSDPFQGCLYFRVAIMAVVGYESVSSGRFEPVPVGDVNTGVSARFVTVSSAFRVADKDAWDKAQGKENRRLLLAADKKGMRRKKK